MGEREILGGREELDEIRNLGGETGWGRGDSVSQSVYVLGEGCRDIWKKEVKTSEDLRQGSGHKVFGQSR